MSKYIYPFASFPHNSTILQKKLDAAAERLAAKLSNFQMPTGAISPFIEKYLSSNLQSLEASLQRNTFLLTWALAPYSSKNSDEIALVDYGGGSGMCSLLAKEAGIGTVVYVDIYDVCCHDAQYVAQVLGLTADHYVNGEIDGLLSYLKDNKIKCDTLVSYDTIEHIYDIDDFLDKVIKVSNGPLVLMLASGANPLNPLISRRLKNLQHKMEFEGKQKKEGEDPRDTCLAYLPLRLKIIDDAKSLLTQQEKEILAMKTRGMRSEDIVKALQVYSTEQKYPSLHHHPTNTCDPITGNWCERLMNPYILNRKLGTKGLKTEVLPGYYGSGGGGSHLKKIMRFILNIIISLTGNYSMKVAPFYCLYAKRTNHIV